MMKKKLWLGVLAVFASCAPTRAIAPLEEGKVQVGATLGQPRINDGALPLIRVYAERISASTTAYGSAQVTNIYSEPYN